MTRWWCSWYASPDSEADPPWPCWCSGYAADGRPTMVAWIPAESAAGVREAVEVWYPEFVGQEWRIVPVVREGPLGDRWPMEGQARLVVDQRDGDQ